MGDAASAWDIGANALASPNPLAGALMGFFGRRGAKARRGYDRRQAQAQVDQAERGQAEFEQNAPIEEQAQAQSLASRGLGTSSIKEQDTRNLLATQARSRAAHEQNVDLARRGKSILRKQQKFARRMGPLNFWIAATQKAGELVGAATGMPGISGMMKGGGRPSGEETAWDKGLISVGGP